MWDCASAMTLDTLSAELTTAEKDMEALPLPRYRQDSFEILRTWIFILSDELTQRQHSIQEAEAEVEAEEEEEEGVCEVCGDIGPSREGLCYDCEQGWREYQVRHYSLK
jgi:hypothetical protein